MGLCGSELPSEVDMWWTRRIEVHPFRYGIPLAINPLPPLFRSSIITPDFAMLRELVEVETIFASEVVHAGLRPLSGS